MAKLINSSKDGVIFINFMKPVVKWIRNTPGSAKIAVAVAAVVVGVTAYVVIKVRQAYTH